MGGKAKICTLLLCCMLSLTLLLTSCTAINYNAAYAPSALLLPDSIITKEINSNRYTQPDIIDTAADSLTVDSLTVVGFKKIMSNETLDVYLREATAGIRVVDRRTNYVWGSVEKDKPDNLNKSWSGIASSSLSIDYLTTAGTENKIGAGDAKATRSYVKNGNILTISVSFSDIGISLSYEMELTDDALVFRIQDGSIKEDDQFLVSNVYFMPFFGTTIGNETSGYIFVPDGCGALIRFNKPTDYLVSFDKRVYGIDYGIDNLFTLNDLKSSRPNDFATPEQTVLYPVFGVVHGVGQNAFYSVIENGAEYAAVTAVPSGITTDYNRAAARFIYRQKYTQPVSRNGAGIQMTQKTANHVNPVQRFYFLTGADADYVGMARGYRQYLSETEKLPPPLERDSADIGVNIDFIMADIEKGFFLNTTKEITSFEYLQNAYGRIAERIKNVNLTLKGWQKGGVNGSSKVKIYNSTNIAANERLEKFAYDVSQNGGDLLLAYDPMLAKSIQADINKYVAITLSQSLAKISRDNKSVWLGDNYYIKPQLVSENLKKQASKLLEKGFGNISLDTLGYTLYAENLKDKVITRDEAMDLYINTIQALVEDGTNLAITSPNDYLWLYTDRFLSMSATSSQLLFETDTVPFLQIVLSGRLEMYAPYSNLSFYTQMDVLKHIDFNMYPSFLLTEESNFNLTDTASADYNSTRFEDWEEFIFSSYTQINSVLSNVSGKEIIDRTILQKGVVKITYTNGYILVNYTGDSFDYEGTVVNGLSAVFVKGGQE